MNPLDLALLLLHLDRGTRKSLHFTLDYFHILLNLTIFSFLLDCETLCNSDCT